jgi:glucans biosynthesis protein
MPNSTRRQALASILSVAAVGGVAPAALSQQNAPPVSAFRFEDVVRRARDLAGASFDAAVPPLPEPIAHLDFDAYRDIRFRPDRALLGGGGGPFRLQRFRISLYPARHR